MLKNNIIESLNKDCQNLVIDFLDMKSVVLASRASRNWHSLFIRPNIWKNKIKSEFAVDDKALSELYTPDEKESFFYKQLHVRLYRLEQKLNDQHDDPPNFLKNIYHDKTKRRLLLTACADNVAYAFNNIPREEQYALALISIYAGCINIPAMFLSNRQRAKYVNFLLEHAAKSGNLELVKYLLNSKNGFDLTPDQKTLYDAAESGNLQLVMYLLKLRNRFNLKYLLPGGRFKFKPDQQMLYYSLKSGNLQLVQYLLNPENKFSLKVDEKTMGWAAYSGNLQLIQYLLQFGLKPHQVTLDNAAYSGDFQLVEFLLNPENGFNLKPKRGTLEWAVFSANLELVKHLLQFGLKPHRVMLLYSAAFGKLQLVKYFLNPKNGFHLKPDHDVLDFSAESGNLQLVEYLLNPKRKFNLKPNQYTLNLSAMSGNLRLLKYLLDPENGFNLKPDQNTLRSAAKSGNLRMVKYLLDPENRFNLTADKDTMKEAIKSGNFGISEHLLPSHILMQKALKKLEESDFDSAGKFLQKSYAACPNHCTRIMKFVFFNSSELNLSQNAIQYLLTVFKKTQADIVDQKEIAESKVQCINFLSLKR